MRPGSKQPSSKQQPATQEPSAGGEPTQDTGGAAQPTPLPAPPDAPAPNADFSGISFFRDNKVAGGWTSDIVPAEDNTDPNGPPGDWLLPSHYRFDLTDYKLSNTFHDPGFYVLPVANYEDYNDAGPQRIADLTKLLSEKPQTFPDSIPFLPVFNAAQVFRAQTQYIAFQNGEGIRFVTQYDQAFIPINNNEMFYTFQGLTYDGKYYVSMILPIALNGFPADMQAGIDQYGSAIESDFQGYLSNTVQSINAANSTSFTPTLDQLDALVNSLIVAPTN